ncbi:MAG: response regulator transcription factor [Crocinitomicaceae bacterium]|nr:response regulator transcription factor [Crocinitomicaceae bacterium]
MTKAHSSSKRINLAIADDHKILREAIISCLHKEDAKIKFVLEAQDGSQLLEKIGNSNASIVLLDISMPVLDGWQTMQILNKKDPEIKVIILSMYNAEFQIIKGIQLGARAVISKNSSVDKLIDAIYAVHTVGYYHDKKTSIALHQNALNSFSENKEVPSILTKREKQILHAICSGNTNLEISEQLYLSVRTIESHRKSILQKTNTKNVAELVVFAIKNRLYIIDNDEIE